MKHLILLTFIGLHGINQAAAQQIFKTNGTLSSSFFLGNTQYARKSQCLYPPSILTNETAGKIKRIYFRYGLATTSNQVLTDFKVKFGQTTDITISGITFYSNLTSVLDSAIITIPSGQSGTWFSFKVDSTFNYDPTKSLILQVSFQTSTVQIWGTYGTDNTPTRKLITDNVESTIGDASSSTLQDFGFDVSITTSSNPQISSIEEIKIYPNPASNSITINALSTSQTDFKIRNYLGKIQISGKLGNDESKIDVQGLSPGIYFFESELDKRKIRKTFVKK